MPNFKPFFYRVLQNFANSFRGYNLLWHAAAIFLTFILVVSGFDKFFYENTRSELLFLILIPSAVLGFIVPIFTPIILLIIGKVRKNEKVLNLAFALTQSAALGWTISSLYKSLTGRAHPNISNFLADVGSDITREFQFGFWEAGIFWGWPSSHTAVAFAIASTLVTLYPKMRVKIPALIFAFYWCWRLRYNSLVFGFCGRGYTWHSYRSRGRFLI
jgi:hypothetical protein